MEIFTLLETLEDIVESAKNVPFTEKVIVDRNDILDLIKEIRLKLPDELKQAKWIKEERERIMAEAHKDADDIVKEAENRIISMIDEHEITRKAYDKKEEIMAETNELHRTMLRESKEYADEILANVENTVKALQDTLANVELTIKDTVETIENNRNELK
jgi:vacuolar-type H+-ATPase subunit H